MIEPQILLFQLNAGRSQRVAARIRVKVFRREDANPITSEVTHTLVVSAHGAFFPLAMTVKPGEALTLENLLSGDQQQIRVAQINEKRQSARVIAVEFTTPAPHFWHIDFPPLDWKLPQD